MKSGIGIYVRNSVDAVELYCAAFGLTLGYHVKNPDGSFYHSELYCGDEEIMDVIETPEHDPRDNIVQVSMLLDSEEAVRHAYELLCVGGTVKTPIGPLPWSPCAAVLTDRFGVWWYISAPQHYPDESFDPAKPVEEQI